MRVRKQQISLLEIAKIAVESNLDFELYTRSCRKVLVINRRQRKYPVHSPK